MSEKQCRCPVKPQFPSWGSGSAQESAALDAWQQEHGAHAFAKARDELARALQAAEGTVGSADAVLDMVADVFGLPRRMTFAGRPSHDVVAEQARSV